MKELNYKLCRKGLLQRVEKLRITIGDFKRIENNVLGKSVENKVKNNTQKQEMEEFNNDKLVAMKKEIEILESAVKGLTKTVNNIKSDVKSRVNNRVFDMWCNRVDNVAKRFKKLYSDMNNNFYDYVYKTFSLENDSWYNVINDVNWIKTNIFTEFSDIVDLIDGFEEGDLSNLFATEEKRVLKRNVEANEDEPKCVDTKKTKKNKKENIELGNGNQYENISSEEECSIINDVLLDVNNEVDEVGEIDINGFGDMLDKYVQ